MSLLTSFFGTDKTVDQGEGSAIDAVTYVASLASDPRAIDTMLDPVREITSKMQPDQKLSEADQITLANVCQKLQTHLVEHDPLRTFDPSALKIKISHKFPKPKADETVFWNKILS